MPAYSVKIMKLLIVDDAPYVLKALSDFPGEIEKTRIDEKIRRIFETSAYNIYNDSSIYNDVNYPVSHDSGNHDSNYNRIKKKENNKSTY